MPRLLVAAAILLATSVPVSGADDWRVAYKRGNFADAAALLQRIVFEPPQGAAGVDAGALAQLGLLYAEGKGVARDGVLGCGLLTEHASATSRDRRATGTARRAALALALRHCAVLGGGDRAAASAVLSCPRIGLQRGAVIPLEPGWSIQFNDRSAMVRRDGELREQPLAGDLLCRAQVVLVRHSALAAPNGRSPLTRHVLELVTLRSGWQAGAISREFVWQLYEVRGLDLDLAAVQRWQEPGSAWPAAALPEPLARGVRFTVRGAGIDYEIPDDPPRRSTVAVRDAKR